MSNIESFHKKVDELYKSSSANDIEIYMLDTLNEAVKVNDQALILAIHSELGGFYRLLGLGEKSKQQYQYVLNELKDDKTSIAYATTLLNLASSHIILEDYDAAVRTFNIAEKIFLNNDQTNLYSLAALYNNKSAALRCMNDYDNAIDCLQKAFNLINKLDASSDNLAVTETNLGELLLKQGKLKEGKDHLVKAASIYDNEYNGQHLHYGETCCALGKYYDTINDKKHALVWYHKALNLIEHYYDKNEYYEQVNEIISKLEKESI